MGKKQSQHIYSSSGLRTQSQPSTPTSFPAEIAPDSSNRNLKRKRHIDSPCTPTRDLSIGHTSTPRRQLHGPRTDPGFLEFESDHSPYTELCQEGSADSPLESPRQDTRACRACTRCRNLKRKCDGARPCNNCAGSSSPDDCTFAQDGRSNKIARKGNSVRPRSPVAYHQVPIHDPETPSGFKQPTLPEHSVAPDRAVEVSFTLEAARAFADRRSGRGDTHYPVTITE